MECVPNYAAVLEVRYWQALHIFARRRQPALPLTHACSSCLSSPGTPPAEESLQKRIPIRVLKSPQTHRPSFIFIFFFLIMFDGAPLKMRRHKSADMQSPSFCIGTFSCQKKSHVSSRSIIWDQDNEVAHMFCVSFLKALLMVRLSRLA